MEEDRARFDNYDDKWDVDSRPHHFHPLMSTFATPSPIVGNPEEDIAQLCHLIKTGDLFRQNSDSDVSLIKSSLTLEGASSGSRAPTSCALSKIIPKGFQFSLNVLQGPRQSVPFQKFSE